MASDHGKRRTFWLGLPRAARLTLFGRSLFLIIAELLGNIICWIVAGILFGRHGQTRSVLSLALLAWTIGMRHALDADHIRCFSMLLPVTCGLFFSLGHSTIVIVVNVAIAISSDIYDKIEGVGNVGAIVGAAVSGSFLFIVALVNSIILWRIIRQRRLAAERRNRRLAEGESQIVDDAFDGAKHNMLMMRILGPVIHFVDRPWKMYPVGVLFGFGFDTASSIALLAASAIAKKASDGKQIPPGDIVILPLLFTAGMTLIDSLDAILMLYSYSGFPEHSWVIFERVTWAEDQSNKSQVTAIEVEAPITSCRGDGQATPHLSTGGDAPSSILEIPKIEEVRAETPKSKENGYSVEVGSGPELKSDLKANAREDRAIRNLPVKRNMMSGLSIILTLMSIIVAFSISIITIMGLIGDNCRPCRDAASAQDGHGGGLAGSWWRIWAKANDNSGLIGAGIVGSFILIVLGWYIAKLVGRRFKARRAQEHIRDGLIPA